MPQDQAHEPLWSVTGDAASAVLVLRGDWQPGAGDAFPSADQVLARCPSGIQHLRVDVSALGRWHGSLLPALLYGLEKRLSERGATLNPEGIDSELEALLALSHERIGGAGQPLAPSFLERVGERLMLIGHGTYAIGSSLMQYLKVLARLGTGRAGFRGRDLMDALAQSGMRALPIITLVSLLVGSILAFVGALQLERFGAEIYIPEMVGVAVAREMAAMMTAIVMAGRTGAAFAAHLASMEVNEEVDALRTLGVSSYDFLAFPRILALTMMMPLLYLYAAAISMLGGLLVSMLALALDPSIYLARTFEKVALFHFYIGLMKSICFGALIGMVSCHIGLRSGRSAAAVGESATRAVVVSIVGIIAVDSIFAIISTVTKG